MKIRNGFVINASEELVPSYSISPFNIDDSNKNSIISKDSINTAKEYLNNRFDNYIITYNGRGAINLALSNLNLQKDDVVTILTTSSNYYISGCVTKEIEKFCKWSRKIEPNTKVIFVNHEFGFVHKELEEIKKYNLPIIEDCAHSFISQNKNNTVGKIGDYVIYSLPKFFPIQFGGILVSNNKSLDNILSDNEINYILSCIGRNIDNITNIKSKRLDNYQYLKSKFELEGINTTFELSNEEIPGVFMFNIDNLNLAELKIFTQRNGIESSVFYGKNAFFIPVHQNLDDLDLNYFFEIIKYFINENI
jgi:hypothetical protein